MRKDKRGSEVNMGRQCVFEVRSDFGDRPEILQPPYCRRSRRHCVQRVRSAHARDVSGERAGGEERGGRSLRVGGSRGVWVGGRMEGHCHRNHISYMRTAATDGDLNEGPKFSYQI